VVPGAALAVISCLVLGWAGSSSVCSLGVDLHALRSLAGCRPSRWLEAANLPSSYEYLSFNAGPRVCPGKHLAELQNVYTLVRAAWREVRWMLLPAS
jgi:hypothetical protein